MKKDSISSPSNSKVVIVPRPPVSNPKGAETETPAESAEESEATLTEDGTATEPAKPCCKK